MIIYDTVCSTLGDLRNYYYYMSFMSATIWGWVFMLLHSKRSAIKWCPGSENIFSHISVTVTPNTNWWGEVKWSRLYYFWPCTTAWWTPQPGGRRGLVDTTTKILLKLLWLVGWLNWMIESWSWNSLGRTSAACKQKPLGSSSSHSQWNIDIVGVRLVIYCRSAKVESSSGLLFWGEAGSMCHISMLLLVISTHAGNPLVLLTPPHCACWAKRPHSRESSDEYSRILGGAQFWFIVFVLVTFVKLMTSIQGQSDVHLSYFKKIITFGCCLVPSKKNWKNLVKWICILKIILLIPCRHQLSSAADDPDFIQSAGFMYTL